MNASSVTLPAFHKNNIPVVFSCDGAFIPYLGVCIKSLIDSSSVENNYDILILEDDVPTWNKNRILNLISDRENFSIRFISVAHLRKQYSDKFYVRGRYTLSTYFRFFIPDLFSAYEKVIYLDADIIVLKDIARLYEIELGDNLLGATLDYAIHINWNAGKKGIARYKYAYDYFSRIGQSNNMDNYFQAGVLLFNIKACRRENIFQKAYHFLLQVSSPLHVDQDVLNAITIGKVKLIDQRWNFQWHLRLGEYESLKYLPYPMYEKINDVFANYYIIHYCSNIRPWFAPSAINAHHFWDVAKTTVFYEELLYQNLNKQILSITDEEKKRIDYQSLYDLVNFKKLRLRYWILRLKRHLSFSRDKRSKLKTSVRELRTRLRIVRKIIKDNK